MKSAGESSAVRTDVERLELQPRSERARKRRSRAPRESIDVGVMQCLVGDGFAM